MIDTKTDPWRQERLSHWLVTSLVKGFGEVLRALDMSGTAAGLEFEPQPPNPEVWSQWQKPMWFDVPSDLGEGAVLSFGCATETAARLAGVIAGETDMADAAVQETFLEFLNQVASALGAEASGHVGKLVQFSRAAESSLPSDPSAGVEFQFKLAGVTHLLAAVPHEPLIELMLVPPSTDDEVASEVPPSSTSKGSPDILAPPSAFEARLDEEVQAVLNKTAQLTSECCLKLSWTSASALGERCYLCKMS